MTFELIVILVALICLALMVGIAVASRVNAFKDDDPPTIIVRPPLAPDDGKW